MFDSFPKSAFQIIAPGGELRGTTPAIATGDTIVIPDETVIIEPGDELRRRLPNGKEETFDVVDPVFFEKMHGIPGHYQVAVRKKGVMPPGQGGNYTISVSGANSRVNIGSADHSNNFSVDRDTFVKIREAVATAVADSDDRTRLDQAISAMEHATDKGTLAAAYQKFITSAANHMAVVAPFLPALGQMFAS